VSTEGVLAGAGAGAAVFTGDVEPPILLPEPEGLGASIAQADVAISREPATTSKLFVMLLPPKLCL
jgi:hypothetical protein